MGDFGDINLSENMIKKETFSSQNDFLYKHAHTENVAILFMLRYRFQLFKLLKYQTKKLLIVGFNEKCQFCRIVLDNFKKLTDINIDYLKL